MVGSNAAPGSVPERTWYVGRFAFELPETAVGTGQDASIQRVSIDEVTWPADTTGAVDPGAAAHAWQARIDEARNDPQRLPPGAADVQRRYSEPAPNVRLVSRYNDRYGAEALVTEGLRDVGSSGVWFYVQYDVFDDPTLEQFAERVTTEMAVAYRPYEPRADRAADRPALHLLHGAIERPFYGHETVSVFVEDPLLGVGGKLSVRTRTDRDWELPSAIKRWRSIALSGKLVGVSFDRIRARKLRVAGMDGEEVIYRASERGSEDEVTFEWYHPGVERSPLQPMFTIEMTTSADDLDAKIAYWDRLIESVWPLPQESTP